MRSCASSNSNTPFTASCEGPASVSMAAMSVPTPTHCCITRKPKRLAFGVRPRGLSHVGVTLTSLSCGINGNVQVQNGKSWPNV
jgi:hypothetical protein